MAAAAAAAEKGEQKGRQRMKRNELRAIHYRKGERKGEDSYALGMGVMGTCTEVNT